MSNYTLSRIADAANILAKAVDKMPARLLWLAVYYKTNSADLASAACHSFSYWGG